MYYNNVKGGGGEALKKEALQMANPVVQVRIEQYLLDKFEQRAKERGFIKPSGEVNMPAYFKFLAMEDLTGKLDGTATQYKTK